MNDGWLWQVSVATTPEGEEAVGESLARLFGRPAAAYTNAESGATLVSVYCDEPGEWTRLRKGELERGLADLRACGLETGTGKISARRLKREDWAESWKRHFKPIAIGRRLLIKPGWIRQRRRPGQAVVVLDPGLSFGTGNHPTTAFCLRELVARRKPGVAQGFLDLGTGSGILAIAAVKLGYQPVVALDFDPEAVRVAKENARRNRVLGAILLRRRDVKRLPLHGARKFDLVCANLVSDLLVSERDRILSRVRADGAVVLAGILDREFAGVSRAYEAAGLRPARQRREKEWRSGVFVFRDSAGARP